VEKQVANEVKGFYVAGNAGRLHPGVALKRIWKGDHTCGLCGLAEDVDHIFFHCITARFVRSCLKEALGWRGIPSDMQGFF
jgi:hypothetical protein